MLKTKSNNDSFIFLICFQKFKDKVSLFAGKLALLLILMFSANNLYADQLYLEWSFYDHTIRNYDIELMPDEDFFILATDKDVQIRKTETGEEVKTYPIPAKDIEFTPDSNRIILIQPWDGKNPKIQIRDVEDFSLKGEYVAPEDVDLEGYDFTDYYLKYRSLIVDPIRPYIYLIRERGGHVLGGGYLMLNKILIYNYETMEEVKELDFVSSKNKEFINFLAVSADGKYLSSIGDGKTQIKTWDLDNHKLLNSYDVCKSSSGNDIWGSPTCLKFSNNSENIYFSGDFKHWEDDDNHRGIFIYNIDDNKIIDSTFGIGNLRVRGGYFEFFEKGV